jgi:protein phosphatase
MPTTERVTQRGSDGYARPKGADWQLEGALRLELVGMSEVGAVRPTNEDAFLLADVAPERHGRATGDATPFVGIADGVGGHAGGARASRLVVRTALHEAGRRGRRREWARGRISAAVEASLTDVVHTCQDAIVCCGATDASLVRMATTLTAGLIRGPILHVAHVGDSRCYLSRGGDLTQLTRDHTLAQSLEEGGATSVPGNSSLHHVLVNVLAANRESVEVETHSVELHPDDRLLFCSDGLSTAVSDDAILTALVSATSAAAACRQLVRLALDAGGPDNVTVIIGCLRHGGLRSGSRA